MSRLIRILLIWAMVIPILLIGAYYLTRTNQYDTYIAPPETADEAFLPKTHTDAEWTDEQIVNAIYKAEGGAKAQYLYGIVSVSYEDEAEARRICFNTVRNQRDRHAQHGDCGYKFLECLQRRYCPVGAKNDPNGLNKNWIHNVRYFLNKEADNGKD